MLATTAPALAKTKSCAEQVVDDWWDNQRVDKIYPLHCYREAIASLPLDLTDYTNAKEVILRALAYAEGGQVDTGKGQSARSVIKPVAWRNTSEIVSAVGDGTKTNVTGKSTSTSGPSSVPIPLIVLAGLAGLLLLAGGAGYVARRVQGRRGGPPSTP
jgi:hypothetical protein